MKKQMILSMALCCACLLSACVIKKSSPEDIPSEQSSVSSGQRAEVNPYQQITAEEAKKMMDDGNVTVVDVRTKEEYESGHISGAVLLPVETIGEESPAALPDLDEVLLIYCRSGNRSKTASDKLARLGYTNVYEFGGIMTWPYEIQKGE